MTVDDRPNSSEKLKQELKMNNVQILLGRGKPNQQKAAVNKLNFKTITKMEANGINKSFYSGLEKDHKSPLEMIQSKLKLPDRIRKLKT